MKELNSASPSSSFSTAGVRRRPPLPSLSSTSSCKNAGTVQPVIGVMLVPARQRGCISPAPASAVLIGAVCTDCGTAAWQHRQATTDNGLLNLAVRGGCKRIFVVVVGGDSDSFRIKKSSWIREDISGERQLNFLSLLVWIFWSNTVSDYSFTLTLLHRR